MVAQHAVDPTLPGLSDVIESLRKATFGAAAATPYEQEIRRATCARAGRTADLARRRRADAAGARRWRRARSTRIQIRQHLGPAPAPATDAMAPTPDGRRHQAVPRAVDRAGRRSPSTFDAPSGRADRRRPRHGLARAPVGWCGLGARGDNAGDTLMEAWFHLQKSASSTDGRSSSSTPPSSSIPARKSVLSGPTGPARPRSSA